MEVMKKAEELLLNGAITQTGIRSFEVCSEQIYHVVVLGARFSCECKRGDYQGDLCSHVLACYLYYYNMLCNTREIEEAVTKIAQGRFAYEE